MGEQAVLSIIVPVYNLENYLCKCIDSILGQTYRDFEVLLVDDGSTDSSLSICLQYAETDSRICVFHKDNGGASSARNLGLEKARGQYISFIDGDDFIEPDLYERLLEDWLKTKADISGGQAQDVERHIMRQAEALVSERVMGVIFHPVDFCASAERINMTVLDKLRTANMPVVMLDCGTGYHSFDCVGVDNVQIGWNLAEHVVSNGAKRILFVYREMESGRGSPNAHLRLLGLRNYVMDHPEAVFVGECGIRSQGRMSLASAMKRLKPDALVCTSDYAAALAIKHLSASGMCVPRDMLVTGVNDIGIAALTNPPLTTVRQPCADIAQAAVETLEWRLLNPYAAPRSVFVSAPLIVRESTTKRH